MKKNEFTFTEYDYKFIIGELSKLNSKIIELLDEVCNYRDKTYLDECRLNYLKKYICSSSILSLMKPSKFDVKSQIEELETHWATILDGKYVPKWLKDENGKKALEEALAITDCNSIKY